MQQAFSTSCRGLCRLLEFALTAIVAALVLIVLWGVATRFLFDAPSWWTEETARLLLIWLTMLGAPVALARHEHLGLEVFVDTLDPATRRRVALFSEIVVLVFSLTVLLIGGGYLVAETLRAGQNTPALNIPMGYAYLATPIGGLGLVLVGVDRLWRLLATASDSQPEAPQP
ncbi:TRAP transporter small permease [Botrimarina mediterranea]|uniref:2,3-diketo-L-gulonate TRAP transporter small permease protein YiaM n=1 Tax=Botrimarina mediterranea TaxID=2528022 RepID=A0A518K9J1_9BACT|nr:TRAP transporter small permease [Botrimarina mediterranea]QDV74465.1 2,3-diketo-L-gulonate TRAP transporter small permease protein YiaM [Botrimarina mediterranea]QDV79061.1 2,3-diketo-L-gulonate TRAP transporter small permease protein YiaM [Planctomycetes bacterium K2D]